MSRMNYNRPRGGYESEPWRRSYAPVALPRMDPLPVREHRAQGHNVIITKCKPGSVHAAAYRCVECNRHLGWKSK